MAKVVLTMVDTARIQDYIFGSNRLRENIGASFLVEQATRDWVYDELKKLGNHNVDLLAKPAECSKIARPKIDRDKRIENKHNDLTAELIFAGGGNTTILFRAADENNPLAEALCFAWNLSKRILSQAPGLEAVITHSEPFEWKPEGNDLHGRIKELRDGKLAEKKRTQQATSTPLLGLGVTAECSSTGLVAAQSSRGLEPKDAERLISREIAVKLDLTGNAKERLQDLICEIDPQQVFQFSDELDHLGRIGGEESYIAVVHIDGNDMGKLFGECGEGASGNREYIERLRDLSEGVDEASQKALVEMFRRLDECIPKGKHHDGKVVWEVAEVKPLRVPEKSRVETQQKRIPLYQDDQEENSNAKPCWPVRPLVFGGDEVTFVCNGQLGLALATIYMKEFTKQTADLPGGPIHTGAGICIVKVHYPFRRAYELSADLTKSAKRLLRNKGEQREASALDWHISSTGLSGKLRSIREREYKTAEGKLLMRPVWLHHDSEWRTWGNFDHLVEAFNYHADWAGRRNKLKALREALRVGSEKVREFFINSRFTLPVLDEAEASLHETGWGGGYCVYFDALEAMDHYFRMEEVADDDTDRNAETEV